MQICPKCRHIRRADETAPDWQCPACGVAYAKAMVSAPREVARPVLRAESAAWPWGRMIAVVLLAGVVWGGVNWSSSSARVKTEISSEEMSQLAAKVKPSEVVMYTTTECTYCHQAKAWLDSQGFAFTECNMSIDARCEREFTGYGGSGTPLLLVRGKAMNDGFDSNEFLALLQRGAV